MHYRMGVDVGGSHTDAVLLDENLCCVHGVKVPTTANVDSGIREAVERLGKESGIHPRQVKLATLGTTHCANAVVERKNLSRVGMIRIGAPATRSVPPMVGWPEDLKKAIGSVYFLVRGGREYNGTPIVPLDLEEIRHACRQMKGLVDAVAITAVFAPTDPADEDLAAEIVREELGASIPVTRSGELAGLGLLDRENATILNAALNRTANRVIEGFRRALEQAGMQANIFFGQNDGTMMPEKMARRFPIRMIACGPVHSLRGAAHLSKMSDAVVVDVGGTTTDVGMVSNRFPRESIDPAEIGGVKINAPMPDLLSVGVGGGTVIRGGPEDICLGPDSVGHRLTQLARCFGGSTWTLTDAAAAIGRIGWTPFMSVTEEEKQRSQKAMSVVKNRVEEAIDRIKGGPSPVSVILVGGGSSLLPDELTGASQVIRPPHHEVANAVGAALGQVGAQVERIVSLEEESRDYVYQHLKEETFEATVRQGADPKTVRLISVEEIPLSYLPGKSVRFRLKAAGDIRTSAEDTAVL